MSHISLGPIKRSPDFFQTRYPVATQAALGVKAHGYTSRKKGDNNNIVYNHSSLTTMGK